MSCTQVDQAVPHGATGVTPDIAIHTDQKETIKQMDGSQIELLD